LINYARIIAQTGGSGNMSWQQVGQYKSANSPLFFSFLIFIFTITSLGNIGYRPFFFPSPAVYGWEGVAEKFYSPVHWASPQGFSHQPRLAKAFVERMLKRPLCNLRPAFPAVNDWAKEKTSVAGERIRYEESRVSMACTYSIVVYGDAQQPLRQIVNAALDEVDRIDRLMSHYKADSPLSRLNLEAASQAVKVEPELFDFLAECERYSHESAGAFDITVGPLMKAWGFFRGEGRLPSEAELAAVRSKIGYQHILFDQQARAIRFAQAGMELDLGGIAKGYAVDRAVTLLKQRGIATALVNACGSTIYGLGSPPDAPGGKGWEVKLRDPLDARKTALTAWLRDRTLSVSGSYEKFFELGGQRYSHVMDPRTGRPVPDVLSVAVLTASGTAGDALDNVFYVQGVEWSRANRKRLGADEVYFFLPQPLRGWRMVHLKD
jgi:FAD:protein FMN transferase